MITTFLIIATIAYVLLMLFLCMGLARADKVSKVKANLPTVSIIVAARNEENSIEQCLHSLIEIDYPRDKLEVIIVNDNSTDRTAQIIESFFPKYPFLKTLTPPPEQGNLRGKTNAITLGIEASSGEILMFTDADCTVQPLWVRETIQYFDERTGIVGGFTRLEAKRSFEGIQTLDWIFLFGLASAMAGWGAPITAIGNNLSIRRSAYDQTGGYPKIPFSVTEDYALVQAVLQKTNYRLRFPMNNNTLVNSKACQSWQQLYRQKQRWGVGGLDMVAHGNIMMAIGWLFELSLLVALLGSASYIIVCIAFLCKTIMDMSFLWKPLRRFDLLSYIKYFPIFEVYFSLYGLVIPIIAVLSRKIIWKERKL